MLEFYNNIKHSLNVEPYLLIPPQHNSKYVAKFRMSDHRLNRETGRYGHKSNSMHHKTCDFCSTTDKTTLEYLAALPFNDPILEDETHVLLRTYPNYHIFRSQLNDHVKTLLFLDIPTLFQEEHISATSRYIRLILKSRHPLSKKKFKKTRLPTKKFLKSKDIEKSSKKNVIKRPTKKDDYK